MILLIDNYDSFSYNLYQLIGSVNPDIKIVRNDKISLGEIETLKPSHIIISPGPGKPSDAGICEDVIRSFAGKIPILGVCLGHQAIGEVFGGTVTYAKLLMHGKQSEITVNENCALFRGLPRKIKAARYHSLAVTSENLPADIQITAKTDDGEIMAIEITSKRVFGVQFHPESILTSNGKQIISNFLMGGNQ
ncbi:MAG: aminodeoxychorismate/anthranilate synthase component II [Ruminococcus sp.]|jgi:anthranilate synthase component 2|nr:aminodeoxychorismate/anthranilate synthase component II [Ruminococcus sp.]